MQKKGCSVYETKLYLAVKLRIWSFEECEVTPLLPLLRSGSTYQGPFCELNSSVCDNEIYNYCEDTFLVPCRCTPREMYSYGPPHMAVQKQDDQHEHTFSSYVRIRDVVLKTYLERWTIGRSGERGSGISVLPARDDDDDDDDDDDGWRRKLLKWLQHKDWHAVKPTKQQIIDTVWERKSV